MTLTRPYEATFQVGDGETKDFPFLFDEVSENFIRVIIKRADGSIYYPAFSVDMELLRVVFGEDEITPTPDDVICIYRDTPAIQDTQFNTLQGYNAKALENILSKIVAMIQEMKANGFSTQILQGEPWSLDLIKPADDGATVNIDYVAKKLVKGLYFRINNGNLQVSADGSSYITMPKSSDIVEFRQVQTVLPDLTVQYRLQYRIGNEWFYAESNAEAIAEEARDIASDAKNIAQDASDKVDGFDDRITQVEQDASDAKDTVDAHVLDTNNPHSVTASQVGALPNTTKYGAALSLTINSTNYVVTVQLKDQDGNNLGTAQTIDLPLESVVVSGAYDSATKEVVLTLQDGSKIRFSVADLVSGLQTEITALNMLSADLVDDTNTTHKFVTTTEKSTWNGKQDTISDLATIRSNAQAGKAASDTIATYGDIVTHDVTEFATATQGAKADTALQSGDNVSELVNDAGYLVMGDLTNFVTKNTAQTISGLKTFSTDITLSGTTSIKNTTNGVSYTMLYRDASGIHVGTSTQALLLAGSNARPKFNNNDIAMLSDIPTAVSQLTNDTGFITSSALAPYALSADLATVATSGSYNDLSNKPTIPTVGNGTITITQGGISKGTFTTNQSGDTTIALDAGGGAGFDVQVVQELPATGQKGIIYLLAKDGAAPDVYDEYVWIETTQTFELIGTTQVDLTGYVKNTDYATSSTGGVVKCSSGYGLSLDFSTGQLSGSVKNLVQYNIASQQMIIAKGTLENIKDDYVKRGITANTIALTDEEKTAAQAWLGIDSAGGGDYLPLSGGTLTGSLSFNKSLSIYKIEPTTYDCLLFYINGQRIFDVDAQDGIVPNGNKAFGLGRSYRAWKNVYTAALNNGADIAIPTTGGTMALKEDIDAIGGDGTAGQVLTKTDDGMAWQDAASGGASLPDQTGNAGKFLMTDGTTASWGEALANQSSNLYAYAIGTLSAANMFGVAYGHSSRAEGRFSVAIGYNAKTNANYAIQLGTSGTNSDANTFKVGNANGNFEMMSADGTIPAERMSATAGTTGQILTKTATGMAWADASGGDGDIDCGVMS